MLPGESFILEPMTVDGLSSGSVAGRKVTTLNHELLDDTMENGTLIVKRLSSATNALLACAKSAEVFDRLGDKIIVELHRDSADGSAAKGDVEEDALALNWGWNIGGSLAFSGILALSGDLAFNEGLVFGGGLAFSCHVDGVRGED